MTPYANRGGNSGVQSYEIGDEYILVKFKTTARLYRYSYSLAGKTHVEAMKKLAISGVGLNAYIKNHVNDLYDR